MSNEIKKATENLKLHHVALARGYVSRKTDGVVVAYDGKFGKGVKVMRPNYKSTQYCIVEYWV